LARAARLSDERSIRGSLFYLGEYVSDLATIEATVAGQLSIVAKLAASPLDLHVSVDPTQIGHMLDPALARRNAFTVAQAIARAPQDAPRVRAMTLDMEDQSFTDATIALHDELRAAGLPVALTLQAYLRRTEADLGRQIALGAHVRLVKGAFVAGAATSFTRRAEIKANSRRLIDLMFSRDARASGFYPSIATHDDALQRYAAERASLNGWPDDRWEIEMLLGVRDDLAAALAASGRRVRLYLPFGRDWWPYAIRRIGENPGNAWLLTRSLISR
jgi:proline dehydrogenase